MLPADRRRLSVLLGAAFLIRLLSLLLAGDARVVLDEQVYLVRAKALLEGEGFVGSYQSWVRHPDDVRAVARLPQYPGSYQPPGYTLFAAAGLALGGQNAMGVRVAQVLLGTLMVGLTWLLARRWATPEQAWVAGWICALYPTLIAFTHYVYSETLYITLLVAAVACLVRPGALPGTGQAIAGGALLGAAILTRGVALYLVPLFVATLIWIGRGSPWPRVLARTGLVLLATVAVMAPWTVRSSLLHRGLVLVDTSGAYNLWRGNAPDTFALRPAPPEWSYGRPFRSLPLAPVAPQLPSRFVDTCRTAEIPMPDDLTVVRCGQGLFRAELLQHPGRFLARAWTKSVDLWNPTSFLMRHLRLRAYGNVPTAVEVVLGGLSVLSYLALVALASVGAWIRRREPTTLFVLGLAGLTWSASIATFGLTRFRLPLVPFLAILAAAGLAALVQSSRR